MFVESVERDFIQAGLWHTHRVDDGRTRDFTAQDTPIEEAKDNEPDPAERRESADDAKVWADDCSNKEKDSESRFAHD